MTRNFDAFVNAIVHWECHLEEHQDGKIGVYSDTPGDAGGPTRWGVTLATFNEWRADHGLPPAVAADVETMPLATATQIYKDLFWTAPGLDRLPAGTLLALEVFDIAVGSGPEEAIRILQDALQSEGFPCAVDGVIEPDPSKPSQTASLAARAWACQGGKFVAALIEKRLAFYQYIGRINPDDEQFETGWAWRATRLLAEANATGPGGLAAPETSTDSVASAPADESQSDRLNDDPGLTGVAPSAGVPA